MARTRNPVIVLGPDGKPLAGAKVHTTIRASGVDASVFAAETGSSPGENPATTDTKGMIVQWLDRGAYNSTVTAEGMEPYVVPWDSAPGSDAAIDPVWLEAKLKDGEPGESTTRKLGHGSKEALPGNEPRVANNGLQDILQAGVVASTDWSFVATINSGTAALGSEAAAGGVAWLPDPATSGALLRSVTTPAAISGLIPSSLPTSGKYRNIGFELSPGEWGAAATVSVKAGTEKSSQAEAEASLPAVSGGKSKIRNVVIKNTGGVYSIVAQFDMRSWVQGKSALSLVEYGANVTARSGELLKMTATATITLPTPSLNAIVGIVCASGESTIKTASGNIIFGDFINAAATIKLLANQHVVMQSDGTNWYIIAGTPRNENVYSALTVRAEAAEFEANPTRDVFVSLDVFIAATKGTCEVLVDGVRLGFVSGAGTGWAGGIFSYGFVLKAGKKWKWITNAAVVEEVRSSYLAL